MPRIEDARKGVEKEHLYSLWTVYILAHSLLNEAKYAEKWMRKKGKGIFILPVDSINKVSFNVPSQHDVERSELTQALLKSLRETKEEYI